MKDMPKLPLKLCLLFLFIAQFVLCQSQNNRSFLIGLNQSRNNVNLYHSLSAVRSTDDFKVKKVSNQIGLGLKFQDRNKYLEINARYSLSINNYSRFIQGLNGMSSINLKFLYLAYYLRFEKGYQWSFANVKKLQYGIGYSFDPGYTLRRKWATMLDEFPITIHACELSLNVNPFLKLDLSRKYYVVMKVPFQIFNVRYRYGETKDPSRSIEKQKLTQFETDYGKLYSTLNISLGRHF